MIYFHANAEDVVLSHELLDYMRALLRINVVAVEYPGYGLYTEKNQKRYTYPKPINPNLKQKFLDLHQRKKKNPPNYAKEARLGSNNLSDDSDGISALSDGIDFEDESSEIIAGLGCRPSYNTQVRRDEFDPYEPYNDHVFESNEENILDDAVYIYDYFHKVLGIEEKNIIIFGRSMGSGAATHVCSIRNPGALLLMSSFKSIRSIAQDQAGKILKYLIQDRFNNIEKIEKVKCPTFLVHGMKDNLIPFTHSKELHDKCGGPSSLIMPTKMDHNDFDFCEDLITPFYHFLR